MTARRNPIRSLRLLRLINDARLHGDLEKAKEYEIKLRAIDITNTARKSGLRTMRKYVNGKAL